MGLERDGRYLGLDPAGWVCAMTPCDCCVAAAATGGEHRTYDPACIYCGARYVQQVRNLKVIRPKSRDEWISHIIADWHKLCGHDSKEITTLSMQSGMVLEPTSKPSAKKRKKA